MPYEVTSYIPFKQGMYMWVKFTFRFSKGMEVII